MGSVPYGWRCSSLDPELPGGKQRSDCVLLRLATKHQRFTLSGRATSQFSSSIPLQVRSRPGPFLAAAAVADWVALFAGQAFELGSVRDVLDPAVVDERDWQNALSAHAGVATHDVVRLGALCSVQEHAPDDCRINRAAVTVWIRIDNEQLVGELARDVGVVAAALLGTEVDAVAAGVARQALDQRVGRGVDDRDRGSQRVG